MTENASPAEIVRAMVDLGAEKAAHGIPDLLVRGMLAGALLAFATCLALQGALQTNVPLVGALIFPVGFAMIIILGLELATGNFGLVPLAVLAHRTTIGRMLANWFWVFVGNLLGSLLFAGLFYVVLTDIGTAGAGALGDHIIALAEAKTIAYEPYGPDGLVAAFVKAMLCNWMVCLGVVMGMSTSSAAGRILGCWLPIFAFFALGFEHCVVNMFVIPMGMMLGAKISFADWWYWNHPRHLGQHRRRLPLHRPAALLDLPAARSQRPACRRPSLVWRGRVSTWSSPRERRSSVGDGRTAAGANVTDVTGITIADRVS